MGPKRKAPLMFTTIRWQAIAHVSDSKTTLEGDEVDPWLVFPRSVMEQVDYGVQRGGLDCRVVEYVGVDNRKVGVIIFLSAGHRDIACYAVKFDKNTRVTQPQEREQTQSRKTSVH